MYSFEDIRHVHLEVTTKCNASCPMCRRNAFGIVCPNLQLTELTLKDIEKIFSPTFLQQLTNISMCGSYGDPGCAQELLEIIGYIRSNNPNLEIDVYTNGGVRSISLWENLASVIGKGRVVFGIDGLEDTNHIYRRGTVFSVILRNARAFIRAGGRAQWDFIVFKHNEHQVEQARKLSKKLGFETFQIKRTSRFYKVLWEKDPALEYTGEKLGKYPIYDPKGQKIDYLELPENPYYCNDSRKILKDLIEEFGSLDKYFDKVPISCKTKRTRGIFISAAGLVYPCCWVYDQSNYGILYGVTDPLELGVENIIREIGGTRQISAKERSLKDIIEGDFFKRIEESWNLSSLAKGRLKVCARVCGSRLDMHAKEHEKQFDGKTLDPWA